MEELELQNNLEDRETSNQENIDNHEQLPEQVDEQKPLSIVEKVEMNRDELYTYFLKQKNINRITFFVSIVAVIGSYLIFAENFTLALIVSVIILLAIVGYTYTAKQKLTKMTNYYIDAYFGLMTEYVYEGPNFGDIVNEYQGKITKEEVEKSRVVKDFTSVGSRNLITGKICNCQAKICDLAIKKTEANKTSLLFIGKYYEIDSPVTFKGRAIIHVSGNVDGAGPSDIDDLEKLLNIPSKKGSFYVSKDFKTSQFINQKSLKIINSISSNEILTDFTISFNENKIFVLISYQDSLMVVPMQDPFKDNAFKQAREDAQKIAKLIKTLGK